MTLLTDDLRALVGSEVTYISPENIGRAAIRYFALAVGDDNAVYVDDDAARDAGFDGVVAPPTFVCETNQYAHGQVSDEGYVGHRWRLPLEDCREVRGGHEYEFGRPVVASDRLRVTWRIVDMVEKTSSRGTPLVVLTSETEYRDATGGDLLARNRETIVYEPVAR